MAEHSLLKYTRERVLNDLTVVIIMLAHLPMKQIIIG